MLYVSGGGANWPDGDDHGDGEWETGTDGRWRGGFECEAEFAGCGHLELRAGGLIWGPRGGDIDSKARRVCRDPMGE